MEENESKLTGQRIIDILNAVLRQSSSTLFDGLQTFIVV